MKRLSVKDKDACMQCLACEVACSEAFYKRYSEGEDLSCIRIEQKDDAPKIVVCVQCGKCAKACPVEAITKDAKGVWRIDSKICVQCGACIAACPFFVVIRAKDRDIPTKCISCGICVKACPAEILEIKES